MSIFSRRAFLLTAGAATTTVAACANPVGGDGPERIDRRVRAAESYMYTYIPGTRSLSEKAAGVLIMPLVTEAALGIGGSYGRGALKINGATVDYYSATQASIGLQIGAQQYAHALFFMTQEALADFRSSMGWAAGADIEYAVRSRGNSLTADTTTVMNPVIGVVFGQAGLIAGATLDGTKYSRIIP